MLSEKVRFINYEQTIATFACPGCGDMHYLDIANTFLFNNDVESPSFNPNILTQTGKYADPDYYNNLPEGEEKDNLDATSIKCLCTVTQGAIQFDPSCTHWLSNQLSYLGEIAPQGEVMSMPLAIAIPD